MSRFETLDPIDCLMAIKRLVNEIYSNIDLDDLSKEVRMLDRATGLLNQSYNSIVDLLQQRDRLATDLCELIEYDLEKEDD